MVRAHQAIGAVCVCKLVDNGGDQSPMPHSKGVLREGYFIAECGPEPPRCDPWIITDPD